MRKVESKGMLCAAAEIGLPDGEDGLLILPDDAEIGKPVKETVRLRCLCWNSKSPRTARTCSATAAWPANWPTLLKTPLMPLEIAAVAPTSPAVTIRIEAPDACPLYTAVKISGVTVNDSPAWLQQRLESIGLRPINNIVDVTNFVLHELGQPLHAFDAAKLTGGIVVRNATDGETFAALDESEHILTPDDLLISDESGAALALGRRDGRRSTAASPKPPPTSCWSPPISRRKASAAPRAAPRSSRIPPTASSAASIRRAC